MFASKDVFLAPPSGGYNIARSVRLRSSASAYLNRTPASAGNRKTWTWSAWIKRGTLGVSSYVFACGTSYTDTGFIGIGFSTDGGSNPDCFNITTGTQVLRRSSNQLRDPSAWYHLMVVFDTTQSTASNRVKLYINGVQVTSFVSSNDPALNTDYGINQAVLTTLGRNSISADSYPDIYLTEVNFIDGQALTPSSFGSTNAITGVWQPAKYTGTYGTNGFYLNFSDNSNNTAATIGKDYSGNGNNWTPNNISVTAGATYDSMTDVPTLTSATVSNYCVINPLDFTNTKPTITNGNLQYANSSNSLCRGTLGVLNAKVYWEFTQVSTVDSGNPMSYGTAGLIGKLAHDSSAQSVMAYTDNSGNKLFERTTASGVAATVTPASFTVNVGDIIQIAYDGTNGKIWIGKNNSWYDSSGTQTGNPSAGTNAVFTLPDLTNPMTAGFDHAGAPYTVAVNFGQQPFTYTPPTGFVALNTNNLPAGTITTSGSFTGNVNTDGPFVYLNGVPTAMTINGNAVTFGTNADKLANGFKVRSSSSSYNASGSNTYSITTTGAKFKNANAQTNP